MYPKFIIAGDQKTGRGYLRMGMVINHKDLRIGYEKIWGGGWGSLILNYKVSHPMPSPCVGSDILESHLII